MNSHRLFVYLCSKSSKISTAYENPLQHVKRVLRFERFLTLWYFGVKNDNRRPADEGTSVTQTKSGRVKWPVQAAGILLILASP